MNNLEHLDSLREPSPSATPVDRIKYLIKLIRKNQAEFAELVGINPSNISKVLSNKIPASESLLNRIVVNLGVSKEWLKYGTDVPFPNNHGPHTMEGSAELEAKGAPVYDIDVTAGSANLGRMFTQENIVGCLNIPGINPKLPVVRVTGDSMTPRIRNGAYVSIRPIELGAPIMWGQIYVVILEDYRMVKYVRRHEDPSKIVLHSENPNFDDIVINKDDIIGLFLVESVLNYEIVG